MPSQALIIIIDAQVGLIENPDAPPGDRAALLDTLEALLADARRTGVPVVFVQDEDVGAGNAALHAIHLHPRIAPRPDEAVIPKGGTSAFFRTTLEQTLHERGADAARPCRMQNGVLHRHHSTPRHRAWLPGDGGGGRSLDLRQRRVRCPRHPS